MKNSRTELAKICNLFTAPRVFKYITIFYNNIFVNLAFFIKITFSFWTIFIPILIELRHKQVTVAVLVIPVHRQTIEEE